MSTRLEQAQKLAQQRKLHPTKHREIVIAERNKEIVALQKRLKDTHKDIKWALAAMNLVWNGLRYDGRKETDDPKTCDTALWNLRAAVETLQESLDGK